MSDSTDFRVLFETHATTLDNEAGLASGHFDVDLSARGEEQARRLGERRRDDQLAAVFCSDLRRAFRTAEIAFADRTPIVRDVRLRECDYGALTRRPLREIEAQRAAHVAVPFPEGESYQQVTVRVAEWLDETVKAYDGRTVLVIGHRATFYALEHLIRDIPLAEAITCAWQWQPGWLYQVSTSATHGRARTGAIPDP